jgi:spartin
LVFLLTTGCKQPSTNRNLYFQDPKLLYAITGVSAYHLANGKEESLTPAGPQTLSLLMVPTSSIFADPAHVDAAGDAEEDFYLHLHLPPELDLPLPATTQIYHQPPTSYLIPRWDMGPDSGAFTRIEFPAVGTRPGVQEDVDTFETILAQCTAFLERAQPPKFGKSEKHAEAQSEGVVGSSSTLPYAAKSKSAGGEELPPYNPGDYRPGEAYAKGSTSSHRGGQIVLVDEEDGSVVGELTDGYNIVESGGLQHGTKGMSQQKLLSFYDSSPSHHNRLTTRTQNPSRSPCPPTAASRSPSPPPRASRSTCSCTRPTRGPPSCPTPPPPRA